MLQLMYSITSSRPLKAFLHASIASYSMDLNELIDLERGPQLTLIQWLQRRILLADLLQCAQCNCPMELTQRNGSHVDGFLWLVLYELFPCLFFKLYVTPGMEISD